MLHDATIEVTCDHEGCHENVFVPMDWVFHNLGESSGYYDYHDAVIEEKLVKLMWIVRDGKHFCSSFCEKKSFLLTVLCGEIMETGQEANIKRK